MLQSWNDDRIADIAEFEFVLHIVLPSRFSEISHWLRDKHSQ